ncbi:2-oxoacid:acceptor oxidoreductase subunit alpha [Desulfospira joergensenii]|uniref:2-oxoacid:acceptor oxidoreductase subunit alpha n=1 Tax=Desulfospira joergensenii TaxID=53329 RepID=UPI0003B596D1|nr:2-oxoacid:acceptor oxidoreductase subunit alpha [Desulfospira joergensenii]
MECDFTIKVGGAAGQGIQTVGTLLARACRDAGYYVMGINDFESRVRGGHSFFQLRFSDRPVHAPSHQVNLLIALNEESVYLHQDEMADSGLILLDAEKDKEGISAVPFVDIAKEAGGKIYANTVAASAALAILGAPFELVSSMLTQVFSDKDQAVIDSNIKAAELGFEAVKDKPFSQSPLARSSQPKGVIMDGSQALALGAVAADCRVASFYPMSPATGIMKYLAGWTGNVPLVVEQAEDEIAAINMTVGASYAGARAMTSTSGGGFCLMTEGLGLAAMTETPVVIINAQRPGPSTGLPTRTGQGDLLFSIHASQDDFPRFVFAPSDPAGAFAIMKKAFNLSEKYQVPAIVLADQYLAESVFTLEFALKADDRVERFVVTDQDMDNPEKYQRFARTESGISPRALPCQGKALVKAASDEHREDGHISEDMDVRVTMMDKRAAKVPAMMEEMEAPRSLSPGADVLLIAWGASAGAVTEAVHILRDQGVDAGCLLFTDLWPFPREKVLDCLERSSGRIVAVEQNSTAQFSRLLRAETGIQSHGSVLRYDGRPLIPKEIADAVQQMEENGYDS